MLTLLAAVLVPAAVPASPPLRVADCRPSMSLASATTAAPQRRDGDRPKPRPKPCMILAGARL